MDNKIILFREIQIPFPIIGIPLANHFNTYIAALSNLKCIIKTRLSLRRHCNEGFSRDNIIQGFSDLKKYILNKFNIILWNIERKCIEGDVEIQCDKEVPLLMVLPVLDCEISKKILAINTTNYNHVFDVLTNLDVEMLDIDPGYLRALRCSYFFKTLCISRGYNDVVHNLDLVLEIEDVYRYECNSKMCINVGNPYDNYSLSLLYKLVTHTISQFIQSIVSNNLLISNVRNIIRLIYIVESEIVRNSLGLKIDYPINDVNNLYKTVVDLNQVILYRVKLPLSYREDLK